MLNVYSYLQILQDIHKTKSCVLIGIGIEMPKSLLAFGFEKIYVAEANLKNIYITEYLIYKNLE